MTAPAPRVSVVMPAYHSDATIGLCLRALEAQTFRDFEAIVVNSSPEERTRRIVRERFPEVVFEQAPERLLPHAARNRGAHLARGELLVFTDPDCRPRPDWLERLVAAHDAGHPVVVGAMGLQRSSRFERAVHLFKFSAWLPESPPGWRSIAPTANACYERRVWEAVGPFPDAFYSGDTLLSWRAAAEGWRPWFEPRAVVDHRHDGDAVSLAGTSVRRGEDFGSVRTSFERWSRPRALLYLAGSPLLPFLLLFRSVRNASRSNWPIDASILPHALLAHAAWSLGEAKAYWRLLRAGAGRGDTAGFVGVRIRRKRADDWLALRASWEPLPADEQIDRWEELGRPVPPPAPFKQRVVREYGSRFETPVLVETGTYRGDMVAASLDTFEQIFSIELGRTLYEAARRRFLRYQHVSILHGDSAELLAEVLARLSEPALVWLDAHYSRGTTARGRLKTPVRQELAQILSSPLRDYVLLIDDARLFVGKNDYPTIEEVRAWVAREQPDMLFEVADDIARIHRAASASDRARARACAGRSNMQRSA